MLRLQRELALVGLVTIALCGCQSYEERTVEQYYEALREAQQKASAEEEAEKKRACT